MEPFHRSQSSADGSIVHRQSYHSVARCVAALSAASPKETPGTVAGFIQQVWSVVWYLCSALASMEVSSKNVTQTDMRYKFVRQILFVCLFYKIWSETGLLEATFVFFAVITLTLTSLDFCPLLSSGEESRLSRGCSCPRPVVSGGGGEEGQSGRK